MPPRVSSPTIVATTHRAAVAAPDERIPLVDLLDRVLARGVVITGDLTLTIAEVDLVHISLRALISAVRPDLFGPADRTPDAGGPESRTRESR